MASQEDACWRCGAPWAADARPTTKPRLTMAAVVAVADGPSRTLLTREAATPVAG
jgi:hypothetical protein